MTQPDQLTPGLYFGPDINRDKVRDWQVETGWRVTGRPSCPWCVLRVWHGGPKPRHCGVLTLARLPDAYDHVFSLRRGRTPGLLLQPYDFDERKRENLTVWCQHHGCIWTEAGIGWWHPYTTAVIVTKRFEDDPPA